MQRRLIIALILSLSIKLSFATGQASELIIYNGDTLEMLSLPLDPYLGELDKRNEKYPFLKEMCSTGLWRGYQGLWKIDNNELFLIDVFQCADKEKSIFRKLFNTDFPIKANWYSGNLFIQHGEVIKYNHTGFSRFYEEETVLEIDKGNQTDQSHFINGYRPDDNNFSNHPDSIITEVFNRIDWNKFPELSKDYHLYAGIKLGQKDSLYIIKAKAPEAYVNEIRTIFNEFPKLKKFYSRGKPLNEVYSFRIIFSEESRKRYSKK